MRINRKKWKIHKINFKIKLQKNIISKINLYI